MVSLNEDGEKRYEGQFSVYRNYGKRVMRLNEGFIKLNRKLLDWEWYNDINTTRLFIHLIFKANWKESRFQGQEIKRGSLVTSFNKLSEETGLTVREVRTALNHLKATHEVTSEGHSKYTVITVKNYCLYQDCDTVNDKQVANKRQTNDMQTTTIEESKKERREEIKKRVSKDTPKEKPEDIVRQYDFSAEMTAKIQEWLKYKAERRESYKSTGLTALLNRVSQKSGEYGENPVMALMDESMANGWRGIIWDRLKEQNQGDQCRAAPKPKKEFNYEQREWDFDELEKIKRAELIKAAGTEE